MASVNPQPLHFQDPAIPVHDDDDSDGADDDVMDDLEDAHIATHEALPAMPSRTSELTLSFEGEVYVFPAVTPQKVMILFLYSLFLTCLGMFSNFDDFSFLFCYGIVRRFVDIIHCNWLGSYRFFGKSNKLRGGECSVRIVEKVNNTKVLTNFNKITCSVACGYRYFLSK